MKEVKLTEPVDKIIHYPIYMTDNGKLIFYIQEKPKFEIFLHGKVITTEEFLEIIKGLK